MPAEAYVLGVDVGGTFTDFALIRLSDERAWFLKIPSTPDDPSRAIAAGIPELLDRAEAGPGCLRYFGHGTTVATNALITGDTAVTGLITTEGFRDVLEIRRQRQPHNYDIRIPKPPPLVPRHLRREMRERTYLFGPSDQPPDVGALDGILDDFRAEGVEAVAIGFLHSYHNPAHEAEVAAAVRERLPDAFICASHEVVAEFREFERTTTTVLNALLGPIVSRYLERLGERIRAMGIVTPRILQSHGGVASLREAGAMAGRCLMSGPAAGVTGAGFLAGRAECPDVITFDVGGTSTDVCLVENNRPLVAKEREVKGHPVRFPMVDVHSVGAGGGSIARVDAGGFVHVGPRSAGANPGPACYGLGGTEPTVTDANVVLGRLSPDTLLGGRMTLHPDLARRAIADRVAAPMGLGVEEAAHAVLTILNENLVQTIRVISVEKGFDPRHFTLVAFGGAGPLLASALARELTMTRVMVPPGPGLLCALGLLVADVRSDFSLTRLAALADLGSAGINTTFAEVERRALEWFDREGVQPGERTLRRAIDMRYVGQSHEITVEVQEREFSGPDLDSLVASFHREHERVYGYAPDAPVQLVTFRVTALARVTTPPVAGAGRAPGDLRAALRATRQVQSGEPDGLAARNGRAPGDLRAALRATRQVQSGEPDGLVARNGRTPGDLRVALRATRLVHFAELGGFVDCPIYDRELIPPGADLEGPAILEQMDSTTVVLPGQHARGDEWGNLNLAFSPPRRDAEDGDAALA